MLALDSDERPNFIELKEIFECPQLNLNLDNEAFVDSLIKEKVLDKSVQNNNPSVGCIADFSAPI